MPKFSPGDPVWVHQIAGIESSAIFPPGEHATTILALVHDPAPWWLLIQHYEIDLPHPANVRRVVAPEFALRPRRDDYQQHEPLGSRQIIKVLLFAAKEDVRVPELPLHEFTDV